MFPLLLASCSQLPPAQRFFDRRSPINVVDAFKYAVEADQWEFAFDCVTHESRGDSSPYRLFALRLLKNEDGITYHDLIVRSTRERPAYYRSVNEATVDVFYEGENSEGTAVFVVLSVFLLRDPATDVWLIDLVSTFSR